MVLVALQVSVPGSYLPPVAGIGGVGVGVGVDGADCVLFRAIGALLGLVLIQLSVLGLYLAPLLVSLPTTDPPQTIISLLPVQTAVCRARGSGASAELVATQLSVPGLYLPPLFKKPLGKE